MRFRFRLRMALLVIAAIGAAIALGLEVNPWNPVRQARRQLIATHERTAAIYEEERKADQSTFSDRTELGTLLRRSVLWHAQRARELRGDPSFDPIREQRHDEANDPLTPDQRIWLHNTVFTARDRRLL